MSIIEYIISPFTKLWPYLVSLTFLLAFPDIWFYCTTYFTYSYAFYLLFQSLVIAYSVTLLVSIIPNRKIGRIVKNSLLIVALLVFLVDYICVFQHESRFNADFAEIVLGSNMSEASEFFMSFATPKNIVLYVCAFMIIIGLLYFNSIKYQLPKILGFMGFGLVFISCLLCYRNSSVWKEGLIGKIESVISYNVPDLHDYLTHPELSYRGKRKPKNIVLIIGESLSKHHCSLYGYEKDTNPLLKSLNDSSLTIFNNVTSAATATINSFKYMMSTYTVEDNGGVWYQNTTIPEVMTLSGYTTHWISNQAQGGNSIINCYVDLFDDHKFNGDRFSGDERKFFDEDLITMAKPIIDNNKDSLNFYVFHLMGSHFKFDLRYPSAYSIFSSKDYSNHLPNQREVLASYDNSVLYNDYVVHEIMNLFKEKEAVVIYLSDHALDIFYTDDNYAAHAKVNNPLSLKYGTEIPFLIYTTSLFNESFPEVLKRIRSSMDNNFRTDNLIYAIMDLVGIETLDSIPIRNNSLFND